MSGSDRRLHATLFEALDAVVRREPERLAVGWTREDGSRQSIRAGELHAAAMAKAHALRKLGIQPDDLVLLALPYAPELLAVLLGALYGAAIPAILPYATAQPDLAPQVERVRRLVATSR